MRFGIILLVTLIPLLDAAEPIILSSYEGQGGEKEGILFSWSHVEETNRVNFVAKAGSFHTRAEDWRYTLVLSNAFVCRTVLSMPLNKSIKQDRFRTSALEIPFGRDTEVIFDNTITTIAKLKPPSSVSKSVPAANPDSAPKK